jgi:capsular polysaccharide biosynthesis protein
MHRCATVVKVRIFSHSSASIASPPVSPIKSIEMHPAFLAKEEVL